MTEKSKAPQASATIIKFNNNKFKTFSKALESTQMDTDKNNLKFSSKQYVERPYDPDYLELITRESVIIPQCITAYQNNIPGFGHEVVPLDTTVKKDDKLEKETDTAVNAIENLYLEYPITETYSKLIAQVERYGYGGLEVIRNKDMQVQELINIEEIRYYYLTLRDKDFTEYTIYRNGKEMKRKKRFRRIVEVVNGSKTYYKEYGDPRVINKSTGDVMIESVFTNSNDTANEIIWNKAVDIGPYGTVRYEGTILTTDGARKSELLNHKYFTNGRHTPLAIIVKNGTLNAESEAKLAEYVSGIEGAAGQHAFLLLQFDELGGDTAISDGKKADIELKELSKILQKDELFGEYQDNSRKKNQSAFSLPDIYVGYSKDYNVATAREAKRVTEEQVFQPLRRLYEQINNQILWQMGFENLQFKFKSASVENTEHQEKMFAEAVKAGMPVNLALQEYYNSINKEFTPIEEDWAKVPIPIFLSMNQTQLPEIVEDINKKIIKMQTDGIEDDVISVMKNVQKVLVKMIEKGDA